MTQRATTHASAPAGGDVSPRMTRPHHVGKALSGDAAVSKTAERGSIPRADAKSPAHVASLAARQLPRRFLLFAAGGLSLIASTVAAQSPCASRETVVTELAEKYQESRYVLGLGLNGTVLEVFGNMESGSWTVTETHASGLLCILSSGVAFQLFEAVKTPKGDPL